MGGSPTRGDLAIHDLTGANTFVPDILPDFYPGLDTAALQDGKQRALAMLTLAATMDLTATTAEGQPGSWFVPWIAGSAVLSSEAIDDVSALLRGERPRHLRERAPGSGEGAAAVSDLPQSH